MRRKANDCPSGQFGPVYNVTGAGLAGYRKAARDGLATMPREKRQAYGATVETAILDLQRRQFIRESAEAEQRPNCASQSWANSPGAVGEAVRRQQAAALAACPARVRAARTAHEWEAAYVDHMRAQCGAGFIPPWERPETVEVLVSEAPAEREAVAA